MKINFNKESVYTLKGDVYKETDKKLTIGKAIGAVLATHQTKDGREAMKAWSLAKKFYEEKEFEIDISDMKIVKTAIEQCGYITAVKGQLLEKIEMKIE